ncbi:MAG: efflux RND transporter periplasmic adaptor subunit [Thermodesulfobacteriota bacterium]
MSRVYLLCVFLTLIIVAGCSEEQQEKSDSQKPAPAPASVEKKKQPPPAAPPLPRVIAFEAATQKIQPQFEYPVSIEATEMASMRPQVSGIVKVRHFTPGQLVAENDLLMEIDDADYQVKIAEIKASLAQARANAGAAAANYRRAEKLKPKGYISLQDYDAAKAASASAQSLIDLLAAQLKGAKLNLNRTSILAPFAGKISESNYAVGDYVSPASQKPLFELVKLDPIYGIAKVDLKVYEKFVLKRLKLQEQGTEDIPILEFNLRLATGKIYPHKGEFVDWDHTASGGSGTIAGRAVFPNPDGLLLPGQNLTLTGHTSKILERIAIPQKAISQDQQGHYVYTIDGEDKVQRKNIEVSIRHGSDWLVPEGLEPGDRVVVEGLQKVRPGISVEVDLLPAGQ